MPLSSLEAVKRVLRLEDDSEPRDSQLRAALLAVESWAEPRLRVPAEGDAVETYFDVPEDATLRLPAADATVTLVRIYGYPGASSVPLTPIEVEQGVGYDVDSRGNLLLRPTFSVEPFEGANARRSLRVHARVDVHYRGTGVVPTAISEGIAVMAAGYWTESPQVLAGLKSEKIGDYSYERFGSAPAAGAARPEYWGRAMMFLEPYMRKARVSVT